MSQLSSLTARFTGKPFVMRIQRAIWFALLLPLITQGAEGKEIDCYGANVSCLKKAYFRLPIIFKIRCKYTLNVHLMFSIVRFIVCCSLCSVG